MFTEITGVTIPGICGTDLGGDGILGTVQIGAGDGTRGMVAIGDGVGITTDGVTETIMEIGTMVTTEITTHIAMAAEESPTATVSAQTILQEITKVPKDAATHNAELTLKKEDHILHNQIMAEETPLLPEQEVIRLLGLTQIIVRRQGITVHQQEITHNKTTMLTSDNLRLQDQAVHQVTIAEAAEDHPVAEVMVAVAEEVVAVAEAEEDKA